MKLKYIIPIFIVFLSYLSCNNDDDKASFDPLTQAVLDDERLREYLQTHYYIPAEEGDNFGSIDTIKNNEASLLSQVVTQNVEHEDIDYKLYYLVVNEGFKNNPTRYDSTFVKYSGFLLDSTKIDENNNYNTLKGWQDLTILIQGWKYGFPNFKAGINVSQQGEPIAFEDTGKGVIFFPSGLAYGNNNPESFLANEPLLFHLELAIVIKSDHDNDGVLTRYEDINGDGDVDLDDDTDQNGVPNYFDTDDDGDGVETRDELEFNEYVIAIGDDDPVLASNEVENDRVEDVDANTVTIFTVVFLDSNNDGIPDYLDKDTN